MTSNSRSTESASPGGRSDYTLQWLAGGALTLLTLLVFARTADCGFVNFDDDLYVSENPYVLSGLTWDGIVWAFSPAATEDVGLWHPLTWLSLMTTAQLFGSEPRGFHLANVALHLFNVLLLYRLLLAMTARSGRCIFIAAVFAVHPLHVESVAWISEHKDVLSTAWALLTIRCYVHQQQTGKKRFAALSLAAFVLSLLAKPMYVTLPFLLVLLDAWPLRRLAGLSGSFSTDPDADAYPLRWWMRRLAGKWPYVVSTVLFCGIAFASQQQAGAVRSLDEIPLLDRITNAVVAYGLYLRQTVWPIGLAIFYPFPETPMLISAIVSGVLLTGVTAVVIWQWSPRPWMAVGWFWYLGTLVPVVGLVQIGHQQRADRYMYFPMIGLLIAITWLAADVASMRRPWQRSMPVAATLIVIVLALGAAMQVTVWRDSLTLFSHAIDVAESDLAHTKVGFEFARSGDLARAVPHFRRAIELDPDDIAAHSFLGHALLEQQQAEAAIVHLERVVRLAPNHTEAHGHLGIAYATMGQLEPALRHLTRAVKLDPDSAELHLNLGIAQSLSRQHESAAASFRQSLQLKPTLTAARFRLAQTLVDLNRPAEAIREYRELIRVHPNLLPAHVEAARLYLQYGQRDAAAQHLRFVLTRAPGHEEARSLLSQISRGSSQPRSPTGG